VVLVIIATALLNVGLGFALAVYAARRHQLMTVDGMESSPGRPGGPELPSSPVKAGQPVNLQEILDAANAATSLLEPPMKRPVAAANAESPALAAGEGNSPAPAEADAGTVKGLQKKVENYHQQLAEVEALLGKT